MCSLKQHILWTFIEIVLKQNVNFRVDIILIYFLGQIIFYNENLNINYFIVKINFSGGSKITIRGSGFSNVGEVAIEGVVSTYFSYRIFVATSFDLYIFLQ